MGLRCPYSLGETYHSSRAGLSVLKRGYRTVIVLMLCICSASTVFKTSLKLEYLEHTEYIDSSLKSET